MSAGPAVSAVDLRPAEGHFRSRSFPGERVQVRQARAFVRGALAGCPVADDAVLCVSEFSANAVLHSRSREPGGRFFVRVELYPPEYAWVRVHDDGGPWQAEAVTGLPGHGLDIVGKIASDWGIDGGQGGRIAWARLDWPRR